MNTRIYRELARFYDVIYSWKDYAKEARRVFALAKKYGRAGGRELLEVACGTGKHAAQLSKRFDVTGADINDGMLEVARRNVKGVKFVQADMAALDLGRQFDVITCLFSSIGYMKTYPRLKRAIAAFERHLKPGGALVIEPWFTRATFKPGKVSAGVYGDDELRVARVAVSTVRGILSVMDMHYLVGERDQDVKHYTDRHELAMFEPAKFLRFMRDAGLTPRFLKNGLMQDRGLYVATKPLA